MFSESLLPEDIFLSEILFLSPAEPQQYPMKHDTSIYRMLEDTYSSEYPGRPGDCLEVLEFILHLVEGRLQHQAGDEVGRVLLGLDQGPGGDGGAEGVAPKYHTRPVCPPPQHVTDPPVVITLLSFLLEISHLRTALPSSTAVSSDRATGLESP